MPTNADKISAALCKVEGKTIHRVFLVHRVDRGFQLIIAFTDASCYEFYGTGDINGARVVDRRDVDTVRKRLVRDGATFVEIGAGQS